MSINRKIVKKKTTFVYLYNGGIYNYYTITYNYSVINKWQVYNINRLRKIVNQTTRCIGSDDDTYLIPEQEELSYGTRNQNVITCRRYSQ